MPVHQFLPTLSRGDAIGNHVKRLQNVLQSLGPSHIFVERSETSFNGVAHYLDYAPRQGDAVLYHMSIGTPMSAWIEAVQVPVIVDYHNVTPVHFFAPYEPHVASLLLGGRAECGRLAGVAALGLADSQYSASELDAMGYRRTATIPILIDWKSYDRDPDPKTLARLATNKKGTDFLYVGRVAPHKRQENVVKVFAAYKRNFDPAARLFLVGGSSSPRYSQALMAFIDRLALVDVFLEGPLSDLELYAHYMSADVYLSMSEHEGFCVPILEAMHFGLPVIAYSAAAVPETLGDGGILIRKKNYEEIAALAFLITHDDAAREILVSAGRKRLEAFRPEIHEERLLELVNPVIAS